MQKYEYLVVIRTYRTKWPEFGDPPIQIRSNPTYEATYYYWWPNAAKAEERRQDIALNTLFNELGQDGWKLVASDILESTIIEGRFGWDEVSMPVRQRWTFVREQGS